MDIIFDDYTWVYIRIRKNMVVATAMWELMGDQFTPDERLVRQWVKRLRGARYAARCKVVCQ